MELVEIYHGIVKPDIALPCAVYDQAGTLLAQKGAVLNYDQIVGFVKYGKLFTEKNDLLATLENFQTKFATSKPKNDYSFKINSPFAKLQFIETEVSKILETEKGEKLVSEIIRVANFIFNVCRGARESSIAYLFVKHNDNLTIAHAIATSAIVFQLTSELAWKDEERLRLMCAALTMNLSLGFGLGNKPLAYEQLTAEQKKVYEQHPAESEKLLRQHGVTDEKWLEYVRCHHEQIDGSGYPNRLQQEKLSWGAQVLSVAEAYCALVLGYATPSPIFPNHAIKHVYQLRRHQPKDVVTQAFVKVLGHYPPGCMVQLANGEMAVVVREGNSENKPYVKALFDREGGIYHHPRYRNTGIATYSIIDIIPTGTLLFNIDHQKLW